MTHEAVSFLFLEVFEQRLGVHLSGMLQRGNLQCVEVMNFEIFETRKLRFDIQSIPFQTGGQQSS